MKDLISKINEGKSNNLFIEVQNEIDKNGEYHSFDYSEGKKKFKIGFLTFNEKGEFFGVVAFNSAKEFAELMNVNESTYDQYENVKIGECIDLEEKDGTTSKILRIW